MLVKELIKELEKLPENSTVGVIDAYDYSVFKEIFVMTNDEMLDNNGTSILIKDLEEMRKSNKNNICDYYLV